MRRLLSIAVLALACVAAVAMTAASSKQPTGKRYEIVFDSAFGLVEGGDVRFGGVKAGESTGFKLTGGEPYRVVAEVLITKPGFDSLRKDAKCDVRQQSLIGEYFIDCDLGESKQVLRDGARIPVTQTSSTVPPDLIQNVMRRPYRERFRLIINELGTGLAGRPRELNEVIRRAHPALRETTETFAVLRRQNKVIRDFIRDADTVSRNVEPVKEQVAKWVRESSETAGIQASRSERLGRYWNRLPDFLGELKPTMTELRATANQQIPTLNKLGRAAPELDRFLTDVQPFARASRGSIDDLGSAASMGRSAIRESREEVRELRRLAPFAVATGKPLRQFLQTIDDRRRSTDNDPEAATTSPPKPDKTAYQAGRGFTGMEALWNYFYWQTQAINATDEFGHLLRLILFTGSGCEPYSSNPTKAQSDKCNSWLGPSQPGVQGQPDPTDGNVAAREAAERRSSTPAQRARPRGPGEPEAPPTPGQPDPSKPNVVLPPDLRNLIDRTRDGLPKADAPQVPGVPQVSPRDGTEFLDYLLGP